MVPTLHLFAALQAYTTTDYGQIQSMKPYLYPNLLSTSVL